LFCFERAEKWWVFLKKSGKQKTCRNDLQQKIITVPKNRMLQSWEKKSQKDFLWKIRTFKSAAYTEEVWENYVMQRSE
jgi:hypothetical protein